MTRLYIHEVVTRDGFQIEPRFIPTEQKIAVVDALSEAGLHKIEVTSFVSPKAVPALADAESVMAGIKRNPKVKYVALVANPRGAERALGAKVDEIVMVISVSESHNRANVRRTTDESFAGFAEIMHAVRGTGVGTACGMATTFGCPFEGFQKPERIYAFAERLADLGVGGIALADTVGMGNPKQVRRDLARSGEAAARTSASRCTSTTRAAWDSRTSWPASTPALRTTSRRSAASAAARSPPGATGNICTEDLVHMLESMGHDTGVDLDRLIRAARGLPDLVGHDVPGQVMKAGKSTDLHPMPQG